MGTNRISIWWGERSAVHRFSILFFGVMALFYIIYTAPFFENQILGLIVEFQAYLSNLLLNLIGYQTVAIGNTITGPEFSVVVAKGCDGIESMALLAVSILIFPLPFRLKWPGVFGGLFTIFILNLFRIAGLYLTGAYWPSAFELLHTHGGFVLFTTFSILLVIYWVSWAMKKLKQENERI